MKNRYADPPVRIDIGVVDRAKEFEGGRAHRIVRWEGHLSLFEVVSLTARNRMSVCNMTNLEIAAVIVTVRVDDHEAYCPFEEIGAAAGLQKLSAYYSRD